ncbi:MAG: Rieske 2Fe-2S domain-containing protein [Antricoccus sp.]
MSKFNRRKAEQDETLADGASDQSASGSDHSQTLDLIAAEAVAGDSAEPISDEQLAALSRDQLVVLGGKIDEVTVLSNEYPFEAGSKAEKAAERQVAMCFGLAGLFALAFVIIYIWWPWKYAATKPTDFTLASYYNPLLGITLGGALILIGIGLVIWAKKLMPHEISVQERHEFASPDVERLATAATLMQGAETIGLNRRTMIRRTLLGTASVLGLAALVPVVGGLIVNPYKNNELYTTLWRANMRLMRSNGTPIQPADMEPGSMQTVFPPVAGALSEPNSPTMLIRMHADQAENFRARPNQADFRWGEYVAFSKICTHLGCPVSLYEQQTGRILCPCHQSQFDITKDAKPIFGPATRSLPQLPITVDVDGYFVARSDYVEAVGPGFWNREDRP